LVILDYIRHYGTDHIGGIQFVGGVTKLGSEEATAVLTTEFLNLVPGFFSTATAESVASLEALLRLCFVAEPATEDLFRMLGYNLSVPASVRQALLSRSISNDDILPKIRKPVLITQGTRDAVVKPFAVDQHKASMPHASIHMMENTGHAPFWDDASNFNLRQRKFCKNLS
jgi:pimeloyl-ACP methyl ester carboxylesterase